MRVEWYPEAEADLDEIVRYIFQDNPAAAFQLEDSLLNAARNLSATPEMGRVGRVFGTRELVVHPNYMLVYRIDDPIIYIAAVVHTRKQYPKN
ncbi:MAG: type II toxin-antitoxin system RelE/ParE family toxin [Neisseria sp.]|jgi:toxin ParE1/3/4|nr:MAG: type II toxin-antitoxin system RelE/ParE family toxin [Neisseria sp.]